MLFYAILMDIRLLEGDTEMNLFNRVFAVCITVTAEVCLVTAAFAQSVGTTAANAHGDIQRAADIMNLIRTVLDPNPTPVLVSPEERAVSGKTTADPASPIATTLPVIIMPDIVHPEEKSGKPDKAAPGAEEPAQPAVVVSSSKRDADGADSEQDPPFSYVFFFGEYVPYFEGWYYYSDRWLWGRRWPAPLDPPEWIPPPPPPRPWPLYPFRPYERDNTIPVVPSRHRIPRKNETEFEPLPKNSNIPVAPSSHRITGQAARQNPAPEKNSNIPVAPGAHRIPRSNR